jgi:colanic acid/amylovoran biosynthesis protein
LLVELGVDPARVVVTGDDAMELAVSARRPVLGDGLGVSLRISAYAGVDQTAVAPFRPVLHDFARRHGVPLRPVPIALRGVAEDPRYLRDFLRGYDDWSTGGDQLSTPACAIGEVSRCRVLVTGTYHAAVFALALGVPTICLAASAYYVDKFQGLADLFGPGCFVLLLHRGAGATRLDASLAEAWECAERLCGPLRLAADRQCESGRAAYARLPEIIREAS